MRKRLHEIREPKKGGNFAKKVSQNSRTEKEKKNSEKDFMKFANRKKEEISRSNKRGKFRAKDFTKIDVPSPVTGCEWGPREKARSTSSTLGNIANNNLSKILG